MTTEQMTRLYEKWKTVALPQPFLMLDSLQTAASIWDRSHDGIHFHSRSADFKVDRRTDVEMDDDGTS
jgi:hypothetical protein